MYFETILYFSSQCYVCTSGNTIFTSKKAKIVDEIAVKHISDMGQITQQWYNFSTAYALGLLKTAKKVHNAS